MRTEKGFRKIEFQMPIELHGMVKKIADDSNYMAQGKAANMLLMLGIQKYKEMKVEATAKDKESVPGNEPADMEAGD